MEAQGNIAQMLGYQFNPASVDNPATDDQFDPLPTNWYPMQIEDAQVKATDAGTGQMIAVAGTVLESPSKHAGRKIWDNINIINKSEKCQEIARARLAALGMACELPSVDDTSQLLGHIVLVRVRQKKDKSDGRVSNEVGAYKHKNEFHNVFKTAGAAPQAPQAPVQPMQPAPQQPVAPMQPVAPVQPQGAYMQPQAPAQPQPQAPVPPGGAAMPWMR